MIIADEKPKLSELAHFGVKGMKWGVRRTDQPMNAQYTPQMRSNDRKQHGNRAVARINNHLNAGMTREKALAKEDARNAYQRLAIAGGLFAASLLVDHGSQKVGGFANFIGNRANENRAAAKLAKSTLKIGPTAAKLKYITPNRSGVHKITTMK